MQFKHSNVVRTSRRRHLNKQTSCLQRRMTSQKSLHLRSLILQHVAKKAMSLDIWLPCVTQQWWMRHPWQTICDNITVQQCVWRMWMSRLFCSFLRTKLMVSFFNNVLQLIKIHVFSSSRNSSSTTLSTVVSSFDRCSWISPTQTLRDRESRQVAANCSDRQASTDHNARDQQFRLSSPEHKTSIDDTARTCSEGSNAPSIFIAKDSRRLNLNFLLCIYLTSIYFVYSTFNIVMDINVRTFSYSNNWPFFHLTLLLVLLLFPTCPEIDCISIEMILTVG